MPRRTFQIGEVLTAQNINTFLMDQAVMSFADSAARASAIATPVTGMLTFLEDSGEYEYFDGAGYEALVPTAGSVAGSAITGVITDATIPAQNVTPALQSLGTATYTVADTDAQNTLVFTAATATVTFSTATAFSAGDRVDIVRDSDDELTVVAGSGVVFAGKGELGTAISFTIDEQYEAASVLCVGTDAYRVIGAVTKV
jgi:hypothetical protein